MEENKWIDFVKKHWSKGVLALLCVATLLVWTERLFSRQHVGSREDYLLVSRLFDRFQRGEPIELESLLSAEGVMKKHPELRASYETMLMRCFFAQNDTAKGMLYAKDLLKRNERELPDAYREFSKTTLLIAEGKLEEALQRSQQLQPEKGSLLEAFNLLRLCALGEERQEELTSHPRFELLSPLLAEGAVRYPIPGVGNHRL